MRTAVVVDCRVIANFSLGVQVADPARILISVIGGEPLNAIPLCAVRTGSIRTDRYSGRWQPCCTLSCFDGTLSILVTHISAALAAIPCEAISLTRR